MSKKVPCKRIELNLLYSLTGGQCFRWHKTVDEQWTGIFAQRVWTLSQDDNFLYYRAIGNSISEKKVGGKKTGRKQKNISGGNENKNKVLNGASILTSEPAASNDEENIRLLRGYFRLDELSLEEHYKIWSKNDPIFKEAAVKFQGVRILAQDPVENLFSFICSSNNNIARISSMVEKLCIHYGNKLADVDGISYFAFPEVSALCHPSVEENLRKLGFGYRAKFIYQSACKLQELGGSDWLHKLQTLPYTEAKAELMQLPGIGAKVADCICLMSLNHLEAIPVDTHIFQVAVQRYLPHLKTCKSVTDRVYNEIGDYFRNLYGNYAGWAHTIIFCADLKMFQDNSTGSPKKSKESKPRKRKLAT